MVVWAEQLTHTDRQRHKDTYTDRHAHTGRQTEIHTEMSDDRNTCTQTHTHMDRHTHTDTHKPVVDVARDTQCCVHTRDSSCRGQTHRWMDRHCATIRAMLACASRANKCTATHRQTWYTTGPCSSYLPEWLKLVWRRISQKVFEYMYRFKQNSDWYCILIHQITPFIYRFVDLLANATPFFEISTNW